MRPLAERDSSAGERAFELGILLIALGPSLGFMVWGLVDGASIWEALGIALYVLPWYWISGVWLVPLLLLLLLRRFTIGSSSATSERLPAPAAPLRRNVRLSETDAALERRDEG